MSYNDIKFRQTTTLMSLVDTSEISYISTFIEFSRTGD